MAETEKPLDIQAYVGMALRRKWYIIIPLVASVFISFGVYKYLPKIYKATTLILVQPQTVPENYVRSTITDSVVSRLNTIGQEILSRTRLEKVIDEFNLYADIRNSVPMEAIVEMMRKAVEVKVENRSSNERTQNSFSISYEGTEPRTVMMVTNKLASLFIEENLKAREMQAEGTSEFLIKELNATEEQLRKKEQDLRNFRERNMGQLPQQLDANLRILERVQEQLKTTSESIRAAEDRSVILQNQIENLKRREPIQTTQARRNPSFGQEEPGDDLLPENPLVTQLNTLKRELVSAQSKYTENHPDVIDLKRKIAGLEPRVKELQEKQNAQRQARLKSRREGVISEDLPPPKSDPETERLLTQYTDQYNASVLEAKRLREEVKKLNEQINSYRARIEDTPKREQEMTLLTRDYDLLKANYQSLLDKKIQSQMAENLERKQQGERFKILDPARLPEKPIRPDRNKIMLIGAMLGLVSGLGLTWLRESLAQSFHTVTEVEVYLGIPVIATIPNLTEEKRKAA